MDAARTYLPITAIVMVGVVAIARAQTPMPAVVEKGRPPYVVACVTCHLPNGAGRPDSAAIAGESVSYIKQQIANFRNGDRVIPTVPDVTTTYRSGDKVIVMHIVPPVNQMVTTAKAMTDAEIEEAAEYFARLPAKSYVKVVESETAPKTVPGRTGWLVKSPDGATVPTLSIVEVPDDTDHFEDHDPNATYTAYVRPGILAKGKQLVEFERGEAPSEPHQTIACKVCHADDLRGDGDKIPSIAGRSPDYTYNQLYNIKNRRPAGSAAPMVAAVERLDSTDMLAIAAYVATLKP